MMSNAVLTMQFEGLTMIFFLNLLFYFIFLFFLYLFFVLFIYINSDVCKNLRTFDECEIFLSLNILTVICYCVQERVKNCPFLHTVTLSLQNIIKKIPHTGDTNSLD